MIGLGLLVRLGRQVLAALEEEDFPGALRHLKWAGDPLLAQILVFRLRLLAARHRRQSEAIQDFWQSDLKAARREQYETLLAEEAGLWNSLRIMSPGRWRTGEACVSA